MIEDTDTTPVPAPKKHIKLRCAVTALVILVIATCSVALYLLTPGPTPSEASEQYIEDHYDAIAEKIAYAIMPESPIKAEITAEIAESVAEQWIPYDCSDVPDQTPDANPVLVTCQITTGISKPVKVDITAPFEMTVDTDTQSIKSNPRVLSTRLLAQEITLNGLSLKEGKQILESIQSPLPADLMKVPKLGAIKNPLSK